MGACAYILNSVHVSVKWQIECLFLAHFHTHSLTTTKLDQDLCFSVHIHNSEFRQLATKYGPFTYICESVYIRLRFTCIGKVAN